MKASSKLTKKDPSKNDLTSNRESESSTNSGGSTPEITARSRLSLGEHAGNREGGNEQEMERMNEQFLQQERELLELKEALRESQIEKQATSIAYREVSEKLSNSVLLTPGPNINKPRIPRPQDAAYQAVMQSKEKIEDKPEVDSTNDSGNEMLKLFTHLTNALKDTSKSDVNMPPKFYGDDDKWEGWYKQWRAYLQAKDWLSTTDHPEGPGAENFDVKINSKIYNTLMSLCQKGKAITYIEQAAEFDGYGANKQLLIRYDGYSKQKLQSLKKCIETMKHLSGTNMSNHIDKFEKICGQMVSCGFVPEQEDKIDWFLASVHERTYEAMHAHCINLQLQGTLTFSQLIKLYTHQCFSRYPHFQVEDLTRGDKYSNNSTRFQGKGKRRQHETYRKDGKGNFRRHDNAKGKGRSNDQGNRRFTQNVTQYKGKGKGRDQGKGKYGNEKGKGKGKGRGKGKAPYGQRRENNQEEPKVTNNSQLIYLEEPNATGDDDETTVMFTQNMNRILINEKTEQEENVNRSPSITQLITEMRNLPDDHPVWRYMQPTDAYCYIYGINTREVNGLEGFITWYDTQIHVMHEMQGRIMEPDHDDDRQDWGSSSNEPITWGQTKARDHEKELEQWNESSSCEIKHDDEGVNTTKPIPEANEGSITHDKNNTKAAYAREERDDEIEFTRIPIAGEDSDDYEDDDEIEEEEDEALTLLQPHNNDDQPLVEPNPATYLQAPTVVKVEETTVLTAEDIAYMIGHTDGVVKSKEFTPFSEHRNRYAGLGEVEDKVVFTQNMQGMQKYTHTRKLTKEEKRLDEEAKRFNLLLFSEGRDEPPSLAQDKSQGQQTRGRYPSVKRKYTRLHTSPITIPGTPDQREEKAVKRPTRFPVPNYDHRNTNYRQPPLLERMLLDDYVNGRDLFPEEWAADTGQKIPSKKKVLTDSDFDFTEAGFANELFRIGGRTMKGDYETNKARATSFTTEDNSDSNSSDKSIRLYERAYACYRPDAGESNAESAERHQLIEERVRELKEIRRRKRYGRKVRLEHTFETSTRLNQTINNKQRRATTRRKQTSKPQNDHDTIITAKYQQVWDKTSTQMYRHDRCPQCDKPVSTTNINILVDMTCYECKRRKADWSTPHQVYQTLQNRHSVSFAKILYTLNQLSNNYEIWRYSNPTAYLFAHGREHKITLPDWPENKNEDDYFLGFQAWADSMRTTHAELLHGKGRKAEEDNSPSTPFNTPPPHPDTNKDSYTNNTQAYDFEEETANPDTPQTTQQITVIMDTGATFTMLPSQYEFAWTNLTPCLHTIEGCFKGSGTNTDTQIGEFHAMITLDNGETRRLVIPQAIAVPPTLANTYLLATTPFLLAGHKYTCNLAKPTLNFRGGGKYTMNVSKGHHVIQMTPLDAHKSTTHKEILMHENYPYDPPTFHNNATNRPNASTPTAFVYHLRFGCASEQVLKRTQPHVKGMEVQMNSWLQLKNHLPCDGCLAGKMRKTNKGQSSAFTPAYNLALSWTPSTTDKVIIPNKEIATDCKARTTSSPCFLT